MQTKNGNGTAKNKTKMNFDLKNINDLKVRVEERVTGFELTMSIMIAIGVAVMTIIIVMFFGVWKLRTKVLPSQSEAPRKPRFRKRDKVLFYGRKMLRKVRSFTRNTVSGAYSNIGPGRGRKMKKSQLVMKLAKKLLTLKRDPSMPQLKYKEPPQSFLEADSSEVEEQDHRLPPEVLYMLRSTRIFGHFENPLFLELVKHMESKFVQTGDFLFQVGDLDNSIYVVQSGKLVVFINESDGVEHFVKEVSTGDSIHSLLSILDVLTGHPSAFKTVSAKATVDTTVLRLPATAFQSVFERFPESLVRVVQIIMVRLQRVTFTALHNYLGLSQELIKPIHTDIKQLSIHAITPHSSPHKRHGSHSHGMIPPENKRRQSESADLEKVQSDFDTAAARARVVSVDSKTEGMSPKSSDMEGFPTRNKPKKHVEIGTTENHHHNHHLGDIETTDEVILDLARKDLINLFKLENEKLLDGKLRLRKLKAETPLVKQGDQDASLIFIVTGHLNVMQNTVGADEKETYLFCAKPGEMVGSMAVLTGEPSFFTIRAKTDVRVVTISKNDFYSIMREQPSVVLNVAYKTLQRITPFVRQIDFALDWMMIEAGKALFRQHDHSDCVYIVLTGRLRSVITLLDGKKELVGEYGRGELVGIVEVLTESERTTTVLAVRDTECAKLPSDLLNLVKRRFPHVVTRLIHLLGQRILGHLQTRNRASYEHIPGIENKTVTNLATVAVLPISKDVPVTNFALELQHALKDIGTTTRLTSDIVKQRLGFAALDSVNEFRLYNWLGQQEDIHRMTIYQCDYTMSKWTKCCIRQADCILIVGVASNDPTVGEVEKQMGNISVRAQKELVLLHKEDAETPKRTVEWLNERGWCSSHHHIRCPKRVLGKRPESKTLEIYDKLFETEADKHSDFSRLARFLTGTSIGLVLGGGGARGLAHIGMIRSMVESGIPIDMVGGTSMGSFIGALWCEEVNVTGLTRRAREWSFSMTSLWSKIIDLTYPAASMFTGSSFNKTIEDVFKDRQIEDLWIPYFCITTDLSHSEMRVHTHGNLWRYVRASMSLTGYLPPLCDPIDGHYLVDGGYVNNLPADVIRYMGAQSVFAIDVGSQDEINLTSFGDQLSGWWLLWKRWNPWAKPIRVLDMQEIQSRLAYVSGVRQLEAVKNSDYCEYIRPPIDRFATLQFGSFDEICDVGYNHGKTLFAGWQKGGLVEQLFREKSKEKKQKPEIHRAQTYVPVMAKFTDLAELVSKIDDHRPSVTSYDSRGSASFYNPGISDDEDEAEEIMSDDDVIEEEEGSERDEYEDESDEMIALQSDRRFSVPIEKMRPKKEVKRLNLVYL
ncbi:hypothetical protein KUTeg_014840 [Tegillarca granosa]|uniref:Neuropathy target esterase sws n=1 Tax=Tegillarca granosa TaxID=220873 RepID=A0ABQ9EQW2_TEGGR|nr:hypothetical protein KUTeg_014840 [Tegillarca granosa]